MANTPKHNMRIPDEVWNPAADKVKDMQDAGYEVDMTTLARLEYLRFAAETADETVARLKLTKAAA